MSRRLQKLSADLELPGPPPPIPFFDEIIPSPPDWRLLLAPCQHDKDFRCIIDEEDHAWAVLLQWFIIPSGYIVRSRRKDEGPGSKLVYLHREILMRKDPIPKDRASIRIGDHINGVPFDNRRENLRWASLSENARNINGWEYKQRRLW